MSQNYGVLRVVRVRLPANAPTSAQGKYPAGWLPEEGLVHVLTRRETNIGRALNNDIVLMDPTVSREHARLLLDQHGWHLVNLTRQNIARVNGRPVPSGGSLGVRPQDILILGSTMLQLIAPLTSRPGEQKTLLSETAPDSRDLPATDDISRMDTQAMQRLADPPAPSNRISIEWGQHDGPGGSNIAPRAQLPAQPQQGSWQELKLYSTSTDKQNGQKDTHWSSALPVQPEPELVAQPWDEEEESVLGAGITMQFALPQRMGVRTRWLIAGGGLAILLMSAAITIVLNGVVGISALAQNGVSGILAALTIPLLPAIGINLLVNFMDRYEREPWFLRLAAFLWGAIIAIPSAFFVEQNLDTVLQNLLGPATSEVIHSALNGLTVGVTEETVKGLGLILLFIILRDEFGAALGYVRHTRVRWKQIAIPLLGYAIAVGLHSFYDFVDFQAGAAILASPDDNNVALFSLIAIIGDYIPPFLAQVALLYILVKGLAHEAAVIREFLAAEVSNGVVLVNEYALLQNSFQRTKEERRVLRKSGIRQWLRVKALYQTEIGLAFRKWHVQMGDKPKLGYRQPEDAYRKRIRRLRNEIRAAEVRNSTPGRLEA